MRRILIYKSVAVMFTLSFTSFCSAAGNLSEASAVNISGKYFRGFRRAPLPFPYQLVEFGFGRKILLCDYEGSIPVMDVTHVGYDSQYIYALDAKGGAYVLHLYDEYVEEYDSEKSIPENILTQMLGATVKMLKAREIVNEFSSSPYAPKDSFYYRRNVMVKEKYGRLPAKSSFVPVDITMVVGAVTNDTSIRIIKKFQNCTFSAVSIARFECDNLLGVSVHWREVNWKKGRFGGWKELVDITGPITIQSGGEFEICIEIRTKEVSRSWQRKSPTPLDCPTVTIYCDDGGRSIMRVLFKTDDKCENNKLKYSNEKPDLDTHVKKISD